jgi:hypothetical protein
MKHNLELKIYRIRMGSVGEYVYCATSMKHLYKLIKEDQHMMYEILWNCQEERFFTLEEFKKHFEKWITESPLHWGFLGGYSE